MPHELQGQTLTLHWRRVVLRLGVGTPSPTLLAGVSFRQEEDAGIAVDGATAWILKRQSKFYVIKPPAGGRRHAATIYAQHK